MLVTSIFSFSHIVFLKTNFKFSVTFISSSANAFNLDQSEILSFCKELIHGLINPLRNNPLHLQSYKKRLNKTLCKMEKKLLTGISSFRYTAFYLLRYISCVEPHINPKFFKNGKPVRFSCLVQSSVMRGRNKDYFNGTFISCFRATQVSKRRFIQS